MSSAILLKQGQLSNSFKESFASYCSAAVDNERYAEHQLRQWGHGRNILVYVAEKDNEIIGWIIFNPDHSNIEAFLIKKGWQGKGIEAQVFDALIHQESLVSAEILKQDEKKYALLVDYGFRPTRFFRSDGFDLVKMDLSPAVYLDKVQGWKPAKEYTRQETVAVEKVPATRSHEEIKASILRVLDALGGLEYFVQKGQIVVLKPNVVADHGLRNGVYTGGIVTDMGIMRALIEILLPIAGKVIVAEGASINRAETTKLFEHYGYDKLVDLDPAKVSLVDLNADTLVRKSVPGGKTMLSRQIPVTLEKADVIINLPVMKTHFAALVSLCVKSLQGAIPPIEKYMTHFFGLWQNLVNIHHLVKPKLHLIDGLTAQENFGPVYGTPKTMNLIIGGTNPVAVDAVTMRIMGLDPALSPPVQFAHMQGLGSIEPEKITVTGAAIEKVMRPFKPAEINLESGKNFIVHAGSACPGCTGYLHYVLNKLRRPDPQNPDRLLIDRPFEKKVNVFLGPFPKAEPKPEETNVFLGLCQQHHGQMGKHLPGCPPHAEVIMKGMFSLYPDVEKPQYADQSAEDKLEGMLKKVLSNG
ncbi:MAG: GNAT family N-acetyltransferase [Desulfobacterales bacterium]|nr:GNAT family N-acetyltransferase [Desulfobacterales bacterium]